FQAEDGIRDKLETGVQTCALPILNDSGSAFNFSFFGLPSNKELKLSGNAAFTGTIYAPEAAFKLGGGGNDMYDFVGSSITGPVRSEERRVGKECSSHGGACHGNKR